MNGSVIELLDMVARWIHVIAGIMWAGNSLLFNWLDRNLQKSPDTTTHTESASGYIGDIWLLHSGAFYYVEKTLLGSRGLPVPLHWFKWQAYTTWITGATLLLIVYYFGGRAVLAGGTVSISHTVAVAVSIGAIVGGWALYESMQRLVAPRASALANAIWIVGLTAIAVTLTQLLDGRAAFLHTGAMLGTIMAANVFFTIVPSQRELVASVVEGRGASAIVSARAKRVSVHNNYFTFPVIVLMVSSHFPTLYGNRYSPLLLLVIIVTGAAVRHILNIRFMTPSWKPVLAATIATSVALIFTVQRAGEGERETATAGASTPVTFAEARRVIDRRCAACHSAAPSDVTFGIAPAGVRFDTPEQIAALALRIRERAVVTRTMPPANKTRITDDERALLGRWVVAGAVAR